MDFSKPTISRNIGAFLIENLKTKGDKESVKRILRGNKVLYTDANFYGTSSHQCYQTRNMTLT